MNRKFVYVGLVLIGVLLGSLATYALTPSETFYISSGPYPGAPSYTVSKDGSTYFAKNAQGQNVYSGTNASQIINNAIEDSNFGTIKIESNITLTNSIVIDKSDIYLQGDNIWLETTNAIKMIDLATTQQIYRITIAGFILEGNNVATYAIYSSAYPLGVIDSFIVGNSIREFVTGGIYGTYYNTEISRNVVANCGTGIALAGGQHITLIDNTTYMSNDAGLAISVLDTVFIMRHKSLSDGQTVGFWRSAVVLNGLKTYTFTDSEIWIADSTALLNAILIESTGHNITHPSEIYSVYVDNVMIRDESSVAHSYLIKVKFENDNYRAYLSNIDARKAVTHFANRINMDYDYGNVTVSFFATNGTLTDTGYTPRINEVHTE